MNTVNELDNLFKQVMQFDSGEPDFRIHKKLRSKVKNRPLGSNSFMKLFAHLFNLDVRLYYAGLAMSIAAIAIIMLRNTGEPPRHNHNGVMIADTNTGSFDTNFGTNPRYDTFRTGRSALRVY